MGRHRRGKKPKQIIPRNARRLTVEKIAMRKGCETKNVTMAEMKANIYLGAKRLSRQTHPLIYEKLLAMIQMDFTELQLRLGSHSSHRQQRTKEDILLSWIQWEVLDSPWPDEMLRAAADNSQLPKDDQPKAYAGADSSTALDSRQEDKLPRYGIRPTKGRREECPSCKCLVCKHTMKAHHDHYHVPKSCAICAQDFDCKAHLNVHLYKKHRVLEDAKTAIGIP